MLSLEMQWTTPRALRATHSVRVPWFRLWSGIYTIISINDLRDLFARPSSTPRHGIKRLHLRERMLVAQHKACQPRDSRWARTLLAAKEMVILPWSNLMFYSGWIFPFLAIHKRLIHHHRHAHPTAPCPPPAVGRAGPPRPAVRCHLGVCPRGYLRIRKDM